MKIKHKLYQDTDGAHVAFIVVDVEEARKLPDPTLLQVIAEEPGSGFTKMDEGVYMISYPPHF